MKFDRLGDVAHVLVDCILIHNGSAVRVMDCNDGSKRGEYSVYLRDCKTGTAFWTTTCDDKLSHLSPRLGYFNINGAVGYSVRTTARQWRRGISHRCVTDDRILADNIISKVVANEYPSYLVAKRSIESGIATKVAISRDFAIDAEGIYYRKIKVGGGDHQLFSEFKNLAKRFEGAKK